MAQSDRDILFTNEAFVFSMLQAVSGGVVVAALAQSESLVKWAGHKSFLILVSASAIALGLAVLGAYWRHQYMLWGVKAQDSVEKNETAEVPRRRNRAAFYLKGMRHVLVASLLCFLLALGQLVISIWMYVP